MNKKKNLLWSLAALVIAVISIWAVISQAHHFSLENFGAFIIGADPFWLVAAVICMCFFVLLEGRSLQIILQAFGYRKKWRTCLVYSAADIYFSAITPSATGGQPASAFFMISDGIPAAVVTLALLLNLVLYTVSIMLVGLLALVVRPSIFIHFYGFSKFLIIIGYVALGLLSTGFILLIRYEQILHKIIGGLISLLHKIKLLRRLEHWQKKTDKIIADYKKCVGMIQGHLPELLRAFFCNFLQRFVQICVPAFVVLSMKRSADQALSVWVTQVFVTIGSNCVPIPGAQGVSDYLLLDGLGEMMGNDVAINLDLLSRSISFYACVLISLLVVAVAYFRRREKKQRFFGRG
ncbi:MAG: flippase-like domain-containing protein [Lachnospiraceae bacterium]|nr:flippase-like domain-containing protein [Lachnospiraceae bacterium]